jgi:hypothetical protein
MKPTWWMLIYGKIPWLVALPVGEVGMLKGNARSYLTSNLYF